MLIRVTACLSLPPELGFPAPGMPILAHMGVWLITVGLDEEEQIYSPFKIYKALCSGAELTRLYPKMLLGRCPVGKVIYSQKS